MKEFKYVIKDDFLDQSSLFKGTVRKEDRSLMNVPFVTGNEELDAKFVKEAAAFSSKVTISKDGKEVDAKRILGVMGLGVKKDQEIVLRADGDDEDAAIEKLSAFLQENL